MKITKRQLRRIISEAINEAREPMTPDYVRGTFARSAVGPGRGYNFGELAMNALQVGDFWKAANHVMDALMIDDPPPGADKELEHRLSQEAQTLEDLVVIGAEWGTTHFRSH